MSERGQTLKQDDAVRDAGSAYQIEPLETVLDYVPPGYKRTEVGVIPKDWGFERLGDLAIRVGSGITPRGGEHVYGTEGRPFVRSQNVGWGALQLDDLVFIPEQIHATFPSSEIKKGDVLLNITSASIGRSALADSRISGGNVNQHVCEIRVGSSKLHPKYLNSYLIAEQGQRQVDSFQAGGNRQGLNYNQIRSFLLPLPPPDEQRAIATALSDADALIESLDRLIAKKRAIKQAAMQQLLTGHTRLPGFTGAWETKRLGGLVAIRNQKVMPSSVPAETPCIELEHVGQADGRLLTQSTARYSTSSKYQFRVSDILFGRLRSYLQKYWHADHDGLCTTEIWPLTVDSSQADSAFLFAIVQSERFIEAASISYGTHMPRADWNVLKNFEVNLPGLQEQTATATVLSDMDAEIEALERRRNKAREIKQGMMQQLLTGRVRLVKPDMAA